MRTTTALWLMAMLSISSIFSLYAQPAAGIPQVYANLSYAEDSSLLARKPDGSTLNLIRKGARFTLSGVSPIAAADKDGLRLQFRAARLKGGRITYGLIPYQEHTYATAVLRFTANIDSSGSAFLNIRRDLRDGYDHTGWQRSGRGVIGYRLTDAQGNLVYEGKQAFAAAPDGHIAPRPTLLRGPFLSCQTHNSIIIWYETSEPVLTHIELPENNRSWISGKPVVRHEQRIDELLPDHRYNYEIRLDGQAYRFHFRTAPAPGAQTPFTFAYASDSRSGYGGGERNVYGANAQIMSRISALAAREGAAFVQFTGDLADGYASQPDDIRLQLTNWIQAVEPFWHYLPFNVGMGNHESLGWATPEGRVAIDGFPYESHSGEAVFGELFVNPLNGPASEDGAAYDPNPTQDGDFPPYAENVFYYAYGNTAMVVLNSDYWYAPSLKQNAFMGGNLHGYIMDQQLAWLRQLLAQMEQDPRIDHIFVTLHTPPFPNGGHRGDCMWYDGDNTFRPWVAGKPVEKGIIERRDELLDLCANQSSKVIGFLCGDEHNYNRMRVDNNTPRYPDNWTKPRLTLRRPLWQFINGAAGAPFYAQQQLPWSAAVAGFTVQNALCLFDIAGQEVWLRVINPDTLETIDRVQVR